MKKRTARALIRIRLATMSRRKPWRPVVLTENQIYKSLKRDCKKYGSNMDEQTIRAFAKKMAQEQGYIWDMVKPNFEVRPIDDDRMFRLGGYSMFGMASIKSPIIYVDGV